jgi:hypothetical protein
MQAAIHAPLLFVAKPIVRSPLPVIRRACGMRIDAASAKRHAEPV